MHEFTVEEKTYRTEFIPANSYEGLEPITQAYGVCFDKKGNILIVRGGEEWHLPGGTPEDKETPEETVIREVWEEGTVRISEPVMIGYQFAEEKMPDGNWDNKVCQLRFAAKIGEVAEHTEDPALGRCMERKFVRQDEFTNYVRWGKDADLILEESKKVYESWKS